MNVHTIDAVTGRAIAVFPVHLPAPLPKCCLTFSADGTLGSFMTGPNEWVVHDSTTGQRCVLPLDWDMGGIDDCFSSDHRFFAVEHSLISRGWFDDAVSLMRGTRWVTQVYDTQTGRQLGPALSGCGHPFFGPDSGALAVVQRRTHVLLCDWPPAPRWPHALIAALTAMVMSLGISVAWTRCRRGRFATSPAAAPSPPPPTAPG